MALTITKLKMWKDPRYTRGCVEVPPVGSRLLPVPDYSSTENLRPRKGSTLTSLELPLCYSEVFEMSYLYIEAEDPSGSISLFGWIDSVELIATSADAIRIDWSVDWWRSYSGNAIFKKGDVTRINRIIPKRPSGFNPRKWIVKKYDRLIFSDTDTVICIIVYTELVSTRTLIRTAFFVPGETTQIGSTTYTAPSWSTVYGGELPEALGIKSENVKAIYAAINTLAHVGIALKNDSTLNFAWATPWTGTTYNTFENNTYVTDDTHRVVVVDPYSNIVGEIPWGNTIDGVTVRTAATLNGCYTRAVFRTDPESTIDSQFGGVTGLKMAIPGLDIPVVDNAYAAYYYYGQREYDWNMREIQRNQNAIKGSSNLIGGAIGGALMGGTGGGIAGVALSAIGMEIDYLSSMHFDDKIMEKTDELMSNQNINVISPGGDHLWIGSDWYIVQLEADSVSLSEYNWDIYMNGYKTNITVAPLNSVMLGMGPLQIQNAVITGNIPPQAKQAIKDKLSKGIFQTEYNPSGVDPAV